MNKKMGIYSSVFTFLAVFAFGICALLGILLENDSLGKNGSYFSSILIAIGYVAMICSYLTFVKNDYKSVGLIALAFAIMYATINIIVYYTQLTTVRLSDLSNETKDLLDFSKFGLIFAYDQLGYVFLSLSTFFIGIILEPKNKKEKLLKYLLCIHGIYAIVCFIIPILGLFNSNMTGDEIIGTIVLEIWCIHFLPICILSCKYFGNIRNLYELT
jgi:hypothetical protein